MNPNNGDSTPPEGQYSIKVKVSSKIKAIQSRKKKLQKLLSSLFVCIILNLFQSLRKLNALQV